MSQSHRPQDDCAAFGEHLDALLAGEADAELQERWADHCGRCEPCRASFRQLCAAVSSFRELEAEASPRQAWSWIEQELEDRRQLGAWLEAWGAEPTRTDPARAWRRLRRRLVPARRREGILLVAASILVLGGLWSANDLATSAALRWSPDFVAAGLQGFAEGPWKAFFLPLLFAAMGGLTSVVSVPLLRRELRSKVRSGPRPLLRGGTA
jgi:hypothetical protein